MQTSLYAISDLHLGGAPASNGGRGFQICPPATQALLAGFIDRLSAPTAERDCRLVIAGDVVDFLLQRLRNALKDKDPPGAERIDAAIGRLGGTGS